MARMKDKAIVGNIGHFDNEIDMAGLKKYRGHRADQHQAAVRRVAVPRRTQRHGARRGPAAEPRLRDGSSELRDVGVVHEPGDRATRPARERRKYGKKVYMLPEAARRAGRAAAPRSSGRETDEADEGSGRLHRRSGGRAVQAGSLSGPDRAGRASAAGRGKSVGTRRNGATTPNSGCNPQSF